MCIRDRSLPNGIEYLPTEASGCINYQGEVWYRKHFTPSEALKGKKLFLHFETIKLQAAAKSILKMKSSHINILSE